MTRFILGRLVLLACVLAAVSVITFVLLRVSGDPAVAMAGEGATAEDVAYVRREYGFDQPMPVQFAHWAGRALQGDLGVSKFGSWPLSMIEFGLFLYRIGEPTFMLVAGRDPRPARNLDA